jgi:hypothetical protein
MHPSTPTYVENGLLRGMSDLSTFVPFLSAFFIAFLSFFSFFFFSSFFLLMLFVPRHLRYGRIIHQLFRPFKHVIFRRLLFRNFLQTALSQAIRRPEWEEVVRGSSWPVSTVRRCINSIGVGGTADVFRTLLIRRFWHETDQPGRSDDVRS